MSVVLENDHLRVTVNKKGAELASAKGKFTGLEYMWGADPAYWAKSSPMLFPIVGTLRNDSFLYKGKFYTLSRHGFARDMIFNVVQQDSRKATFQLVSNDITFEKYPFDFVLEIGYEITDDFLRVNYIVKNPGTGIMYFSIGGHPAFKVPLTDNTTFEDYFLQFHNEENAPRWPIDSHGLILDTPIPLLEGSSTLKLTHELFSEDALVFKSLKSHEISIKSDMHEHGLDFYFDGFPYLGIWSYKDAEFVCIEPWCGIADSISHNQNLVDKEGIQKLAPSESWSRSWKVRFY
jgi:galactose mutarotase-like enzyme